MVAVNLEELKEAVDFVSGGEEFDNAAYISLETGRIFFHSTLVDMGEDLPEEIDDAYRYLPVPHRYDLDLSRRLALDFAAAELPADLDQVFAYFRRPGAYRRFKALLATRDKLDTWFAFEDAATESALRGWCTENGLELLASPPSP